MRTGQFSSSRAAFYPCRGSATTRVQAVESVPAGIRELLPAIAELVWSPKRSLTSLNPAFQYLFLAAGDDGNSAGAWTPRRGAVRESRPRGKVQGEMQNLARSSALPLRFRLARGEAGVRAQLGRALALWVREDERSQVAAAVGLWRIAVVRERSLEQRKVRCREREVLGQKHTDGIESRTRACASPPHKRPWLAGSPRNVASAGRAVCVQRGGVQT